MIQFILLWLLSIIVLGITTYHISSLIAEAEITSWFRGLFKPKSFFHRLFSCVLCTSVWVGWLLSFLVFNAFAYYESDIVFKLNLLLINHKAATILALIISHFLSGILYSAVTWFLHLWEVKLISGR